MEPTTDIDSPPSFFCKLSSQNGSPNLQVMKSFQKDSEESEEMKKYYLFAEWVKDMLVNKTVWQHGNRWNLHLTAPSC